MAGPAPDLAKRAKAAALYERLGTVAKVAEELDLTTARAHVLIVEGGGVLARPGRRPGSQVPPASSTS